MTSQSAPACPVLPRPTLLVSAMLSVFSSAAWAAADVAFNPQFLQGAASRDIDLSRFEQGQALPGTYNADIKVNGIIVARREVQLRALSDTGAGTVLCLSPTVIDALGLNHARLQALATTGAVDAGGVMQAVQSLPDASFCDPLDHYVPDASARFDVGEQVLEVSIPQAYLAQNPRGWVSPQLWDRGVTAGRLGYSINHQQMSSRGQSQQFTSATLNAGLNAGDWRLRHEGFFSQSSALAGRYRAGRTYAQRAMPAFGMEMTVGQSSSPGDLFEAMGFRGVSVATDPRMLPDSQRDYAPIVRGVAQSNAQVVVRQRDYVLYQTTVAAGPFEIDDLYGTAYAGDLQVEVIESDGRIQQFTVPFASVPQLLRPGQHRASLTVGALDDAWLRSSPAVMEGTLRRGFNNLFTGYGGVTGSVGYRAVVAGGALNTVLGALSGDVTQAWTSLPRSASSHAAHLRGQSFRVGYSKDIPATRSSISMAAYRYSSAGFLTLNEAARLRQDWRDGLGSDGVRRQRTRLDLTVNQRFGERGGAVYASGSSTTYWNLHERRTQYSLGYSNAIGVVSYSLSAQRSVERNLFDTLPTREVSSVSLNVTLPFGVAPSAPRFNGTLTRGNEGRDALRSGLTGYFGEQHQGTYSASADRNGGQGSTYDASVGYQTRASTLSAGYSHSGSARGVTLGASGGAVLHAGGVTFAQQLGDTIAVLEVPGAFGARVGGNIGMKTDGRGFAVVPYLQPYRRNDVIVDPKGLPMDVELKSASALAVPTAGAVVKLLVATETGRSALIEARQADGAPLPFGLDVRNAAGEVVGVVGQASRLWVRRLDEAGELSVHWGQERGHTCVISYVLDGKAPDDLIRSTCRSPEAPQ